MKSKIDRGAVLNEKPLYQATMIYAECFTNVDMMVELGLVLRPVEGEGQGDEPLPGKQRRPINGSRFGFFYFRGSGPGLFTVGSRSR